MKRRDSTEVKALRTVLAAIANAEAVTAAPVVGSSGPIAGAVGGLGAGDTARRDLSDRDVLDIVDAEIAERLASAAQYDTLRQSAAAHDLRAQARVLQAYVDA
jgi:uncharacterized protein YqeY